MKTAVRTLAIATVIALLTWSANEAAAAARPSLAEPPSAMSIEDGAELDSMAESVTRPTTTARERPSVGPRFAAAEPEHSERTRGAWHPTRHACDGSPDH